MLHSKLMRALLPALGLALCASARPTSADTLNGAGATFPAPIYTKWFQAYHQAHPNVTINYQAVGSGQGIAQYKAGSVDFGASDAPLSNQELASMPTPTLHIPTVAGAVVMAYNVPGIGAGLRLSGDVIADIYLGKLNRWNDPRIARQNPRLRLPNRPILVAHRSDGSGTSFIFTSYLSAVSPEWKTRVGAGKSVNWPTGVGAPGNPGVSGVIAKTPGAIGYIELAYALQNHIPYGSVRNRAGNYVTPSVATTTAAAAAAASRMRQDVRTVIVDSPGLNAYPICGFTYLLVSKTPKNPARAREVLDLIRWAMGPGQQMAPQLLYAPLPKAVVAINLAALQQVRVAGK